MLAKKWREYHDVKNYLDSILIEQEESRSKRRPIEPPRPSLHLTALPSGSGIVQSEPEGPLESTEPVDPEDSQTTRVTQRRRVSAEVTRVEEESQGEEKQRRVSTTSDVTAERPRLPKRIRTTAHKETHSTEERVETPKKVKFNAFSLRHAS